MFVASRHATVLVFERIDALGDVGLDDIHAKEARSSHLGGGEDVLGHILAIDRPVALSIIRPSRT